VRCVAKWCNVAELSLTGNRVSSNVINFENYVSSSCECDINALCQSYRPNVNIGRVA
jgi:hypothetical protein